MPRMARKVSRTKVYHVIFRGNDKQDIFFDVQDYKKMMKEIVKTKEKYQYEIFAYCLMTNHVHLILYDRNDNISKAMQGLIVSYSSYFGKKYEKVGHLVQGRFFSKNVETREYLIQLCKYIHQNPVKAKISKLNEYRWSSYNEYINNSNLVETRMILNILGKTKQEAIKNFVSIHQKEEEQINDYVEFEIISKLTDIEVKKRVEKVLELNNIREIKNYNVQIRNAKIRKLKEIKGTSKSQIARVLGISRKIIERAME